MAEYKDNRNFNFLLQHLEYHNTYKKTFNNEEEESKKLIHFIIDRPGRVAGNPPPLLRVRLSSVSWIDASIYIEIMGQLDCTCYHPGNRGSARSCIFVEA